MSKVLGIDQGMERLGFGSLSKVDSEIILGSYGVIANPRNAGDAFNIHLNRGIEQITNDFPRLISMAQPDFICAELVPPGRLGANTELVVAAITVCKVIAFQFGIEWHDLAANTVKKEFTGDAAASKAVIKRRVIELFPQLEDRHKALKKEQREAGLKSSGLPPDVFDAIAIAHVGASKY